MSALPPSLVDALLEVAAARSGSSPSSVSLPVFEEAIRRLIDGGLDAETLVARAESGDPQVIAVLRAAIAVGETYFFRQPDHFELLLRWLSSRHATSSISAWSAGCATGEEAYSIAACLRSSLPDDVAISVLGTDLIPDHIAAAELASYGAWSVRGSSPLLWPVLGQSDGERSTVIDEVRALVRFREHDLLGEAPGIFDVIFCRNVFVYLAPDVIAKATARLVNALRPGGLIAFGPVDVDGVPPGLVRLRGDANAFVKPEHVSEPLPRAASTMPTPPAAPSPPARSEESTPVQDHVRALLLMERGHQRSAEIVLEELSRRQPDYLPGLLECALLHARRGRAAVAAAMMAELLRRSTSIRPDQVIAGPEDLPVAYYLASARAFLAARSSNHDVTAGSSVRERGNG